LYVIFNQANNNRYVGKAGDMARRFNGRMLTVNEFGLSQANLAQIGVFWGVAQSYNTPVPAGQATVPPLHTLLQNPGPLWAGFRIIRSTVGAPPALPAAVVGTAGGAINYTGNPVTTVVDGQTVNVEGLLIRTFRQGMGVGGTFTNLAYMGPFTNPTNEELIVVVQWAACGVVSVPQAHFIMTIPANGTF